MEECSHTNGCLSKEGKLLKTDSSSHGDDHFFPGPTDIAWDWLAPIIEWQMNEEQTMKFLDHYCHVSRDDASARIDGFIKAYAAFRSGLLPHGSECHERIGRADASAARSERLSSGVGEDAGAQHGCSTGN